MNWTQLGRFDPLALSEQRGQTTLVLEDPGGEPLDRLLPGPMQMPQFFRFAVGTTVALSEVVREGADPQGCEACKFLLMPRRVRLASWALRLLHAFRVSARRPNLPSS
jgi:hypothetical protein